MSSHSTSSSWLASLKLESRHVVALDMVSHRRHHLFDDNSSQGTAVTTTIPSGCEMASLLAEDEYNQTPNLLPRFSKSHFLPDDVRARQLKVHESFSPPHDLNAGPKGHKCSDSLVKGTKLIFPH